MSPQERGKKDRNPLKNKPSLFTAADDADMKAQEEKQAQANSSTAKLVDGLTRATFIVKQEQLKKLKNYAYTERLTLKEVIEVALAEYIEKYYDPEEAAGKIIEHYK